MDIETELSKAREYADRGKKYEARQRLRKILAADHRNEEAWFLFSRVAQQKEHEIQCLQRLLVINPNHRKAQERLSLLQSRPMTAGNHLPPESGEKPEPAEQDLRVKFHHPKLTPPVITDPFNPLFINILLKIEPEKMVFYSGSVLFQSKKLGEECAGDIETIRREYRTAGRRRWEILKRSALRGFLWMVVFFLYLLFFRSYGIADLLLMLMIIGAALGLLNFVLNGGLTTWDDKVRFTCMLIRERKPFILEMDPKTEAEVIRELARNGMAVDGKDSFPGDSQ